MIRAGDYMPEQIQVEFFQPNIELMAKALESQNTQYENFLALNDKMPKHAPQYRDAALQYKADMQKRALDVEEAFMRNKNEGLKSMFGAVRDIKESWSAGDAFHLEKSYIDYEEEKKRLTEQLTKWERPDLVKYALGTISHTAFKDAETGAYGSIGQGNVYKPYADSEMIKWMDDHLANLKEGLLSTGMNKEKVNSITTLHEYTTVTGKNANEVIQTLVSAMPEEYKKSIAQDALAQGRNPAEDLQIFDYEVGEDGQPKLKSRIVGRGSYLGKRSVKGPDGKTMEIDQYTQTDVLPVFAQSRVGKMLETVLQTQLAVNEEVDRHYVKDDAALEQMRFNNELKLKNLEGIPPLPSVEFKQQGEIKFTWDSVVSNVQEKGHSLNSAKSAIDKSNEQIRAGAKNLTQQQKAELRKLGIDNIDAFDLRTSFANAGGPENIARIQSKLKEFGLVQGEGDLNARLQNYNSAKSQFDEAKRIQDELWNKAGGNAELKSDVIDVKVGNTNAKLTRTGETMPSPDDAGATTFIQYKDASGKKVWFDPKTNNFYNTDKTGIPLRRPVQFTDRSGNVLTTGYEYDPANIKFETKPSVPDRNILNKYADEFAQNIMRNQVVYTQNLIAYTDANGVNRNKEYGELFWNAMTDDALDPTSFVYAANGAPLTDKDKAALNGINLILKREEGRQKYKASVTSLDLQGEGRSYIVVTLNGKQFRAPIPEQTNRTFAAGAPSLRLALNGRNPGDSQSQDLLDLSLAETHTVLSKALSGNTSSGAFLDNGIQVYDSPKENGRFLVFNENVPETKAQIDKLKADNSENVTIIQTANGPKRGVRINAGETLPEVQSIILNQMATGRWNPQNVATREYNLARNQAAAFGTPVQVTQSQSMSAGGVRQTSSSTSVQYR